jgi:hypothetical protein
LGELWDLYKAKDSEIKDLYKAKDAQVQAKDSEIKDLYKAKDELADANLRAEIAVVKLVRSSLSSFLETFRAAASLEYFHEQVQLCGMPTNWSGPCVAPQTNSLNSKNAEVLTLRGVVDVRGVLEYVITHEARLSAALPSFPPAVRRARSLLTSRQAGDTSTVCPLDVLL